jgi:thiopurine S-methyltransferase
MHHEFWHERWQTGQIGFHQSAVHPMLARCRPLLDLPSQARVYVPLCGKSLDMAWLAERGHRVVGSELSDIAIRDFFTERGLAPAITEAGGFVVHAAGPYEILQGDALALPPAVLGGIDAVYDRAALVALPPEMRGRYAATLAELVPAGSPMLMIALEYPQAMKEGPPFSVKSAEVLRLFGAAFAIHELERADLIGESPRFAEAGIHELHEVVYRLERRACSTSSRSTPSG